MSDVITNLMLHKSRAERLFCAATLLNGDIALRDTTWLQPEKFKDERYRNYWRNVLDKVEPAKAAIDSGIYDELLNAQSEVIGAFAHRDFSKVIVDDDYLIGISAVLPEIARACNDRAISDVNKRIAELSGVVLDGGSDIPNAIDAAMEFATYISKPIDVIYTGLPDFDRKTAGFEKGTVTLLAARPGMGKSALGITIGEYNAMHGNKVIYFSLEMLRRQCWARIACGKAGVSWMKVRAGKLTDDESEHLGHINGQLMNEFEDRLLIDDTCRLTMDEIWRRCSRYGPDLIIIDHLALVGDKNENEVRRLGEISWAGKMLAKELNCHVIFCQQLNRAVDGRANRRPMLSDLRDSGELEQNADQVVFIYRDDYYNGNPLRVSPAELIIAKYRDGLTGSVKAIFNLDKQRFYCQQEAK